MLKNILILTCGKGGGHRNSSDAIKSALLKLNPSVDINDFDSNELFYGYSGDGGEEGYISFTTRYRFFWKCFFEITSFFRIFSNFILYKSIFRRFSELIKNYKPDIILSVHPCFVGSINKCLKKLKLSTPLFVCIIDLVKHSHLWHDKECEITFVPTLKMYNYLLKKGFKKEKLIHSGFPINEKFNKINKKPKEKILVPNILMVSPSQKHNKVILQLILTTLNYNVNLTVVTGSNKKLKKHLDNRLTAYMLASDHKKFLNVKNVTVLGYVSDMDTRLSNADVLITKAGPNMILEAVKMCVPVLITGHIPGQEEKNYQYIVENGYGLKCDSPKKLSNALGRLFENDYKMLKEFSHNEQGCNDTSGTEVVAQHLLEVLNKGELQEDAK